AVPLHRRHRTRGAGRARRRVRRGCRCPRRARACGMTVHSAALSGLGPLIESRHVVVCCGTGGVGKTTAAAPLALAGARRGRNAVVVTSDPAKRLANALGVGELSNAAVEIERSRWNGDGNAIPGGSLHALMLDTKRTFDQLVVDHAVDEAQACRILDNR